MLCAAAGCQAASIAAMQAAGGDSSLAEAHEHGSGPLPLEAADAGSAEGLVADASSCFAATTTTNSLTAAEGAAPEVSLIRFLLPVSTGFLRVLRQCMFNCPVLTHWGSRHQN